MKRTKHRRPTAILSADWHLRMDQPVCRIDDFPEAQWKKVVFISDLQKKYDCPVWHPGDLFNHWKPSPQLISQALIHLPDQFITIYGNHDLPQHSLQQADKCGIYTLLSAGRVRVAPECHWQETPVKGSFKYRHNTHKILLWHVMVYQGRKPWPDCTAPSAAKLLKKYPEYDLIVTGHNHKPFVEEYEGRLLVNPGSITRMDADQEEHRPRVYLWYAEDNTVDPVYLPIEADVVSRDHIDLKKERTDRIDAFISKLDGDWEAGVSFEENLERFSKKNKTKKPIMEIVNKAIEI